MKHKNANIVIIEGCGDKLLDTVLTHTTYEIEGIGSILLHTDDLTCQVRIPELDLYTKTELNGYEGLILLRR